MWMNHISPTYSLQPFKQYTVVTHDAVRLYNVLFFQEIQICYIFYNFDYI